MSEPSQNLKTEIEACRQCCGHGYLEEPVDEEAREGEKATCHTCCGRGSVRVTYRLEWKVVRLERLED
jgi:DnaJ-class molecular chaperone